MRFKTNKVWVAVDQNDEPVVESEKVLIKYQLNQDYEYRVNVKAIQALDSPIFDNDSQHIKSDETKRKSASRTSGISAHRNTISIYTDGASSGNPGPSGIGILLKFGNHQKEISKHIGMATNNIAELEAIKAGLMELKKTDVPVTIYTDSSYAHGVLALGWKAKKNVRLIESIKKLISKFNDVNFVRIKGHNHIEGNERADQLATAAVHKV